MNTLYCKSKAPNDTLRSTACIVSQIRIGKAQTAVHERATKNTQGRYTDATITSGIGSAPHRLAKHLAKPLSLFGKNQPDTHKELYRSSREDPNSELPKTHGEF